MSIFGGQGFDMRFIDREDAGKQLAELLADYVQEHPLVLGLPRGGIPVAYEVSAALDCPLDVWIVRKVGAPDSPEFGIGAVAEGGAVYLDEDVIDEMGIPDSEIRELVWEKSEEVALRVKRYRGDSPAPRIAGRTVILVDDGIATGSTMRAAIGALRAANPDKIVLAVPVASLQGLETLSPLVDDVVCVHPTPALFAVGSWYDDFEQLSDAEVIRILTRARNERGAQRHSPIRASPFDPRELTIQVDGAKLHGTLAGPASPRGLVLFAHGSGSSRFSPRNGVVAAALHGFGFATLLFDLLTEDEESLDEETAELRFDVDLLARRLMEVTDWARSASLTRGLPLGYFGSSTGAAAALIAAAHRPEAVSAIVSRGGRPDLASSCLSQVRAPTLLIVGGDDVTVLGLNTRVQTRLTGLSRLAVVPGARHLFEEPGALDAVARLSGEWYREHLRGDVEAPGLTPAVDESASTL